MTFLELLQNFIRRGDASSLRQQLLKSCLGVECKDVIDNTPLLQAAFLGKSECVKLLLEIGQANFKVINVLGMQTSVFYIQIFFKIFFFVQDKMH